MSLFLHLCLAGKQENFLNYFLIAIMNFLVSTYVNAEFKAKLEQKWHDKAEIVYMLYHTLPFVFCESSPEQKGELRDTKDIPVLSDAVFHNADIILSGDKDFLEAGLEKPQDFSPAMLYDYLI